MVLSLPFIASAVMMLEIVWDESLETAATDGDYIYANPRFIGGLNERQKSWLLAHEALHCVLMHHIRVGNRDFKLYNIAADYVINLILNEVNELEMVSGALLDFKFLNWATEEVYNHLKQLPQEKQKQLKSQHNDAGSFMKPGTGSGSSEKDKNEKEKTKKDDKKSSGGSDKRQDGNIPKANFGAGQEQKWSIFNHQAAYTASKIGGNFCGFGSQSLQRVVDQLVNPKVPWNQYLWSFMDQTARDDYDYNKFNRRYIQYGYYFPSLYSVKMGFLAIAVDTSGSISVDDLNRFATEINAIKSAYNCKVLLMYCDARVSENHVKIFEEEDELVINPIGGGGTDFRPPFKYIERQGLEDEIRCMIYFTDGLCYSYPDEPIFPVLWVGTRNFDPPFGEHVLMEMD